MTASASAAAVSPGVAGSPVRGRTPEQVAAQERMAARENERGLAANKAGDIRAALTHFTVATELDASEHRYLLSMANMRLKLGEAAAAVPMYEKLLAEQRRAAAALGTGKLGSGSSSDVKLLPAAHIKMAESKLLEAKAAVEAGASSPPKVPARRRAKKDTKVGGGAEDGDAAYVEAVAREVAAREEAAEEAAAARARQAAASVAAEKAAAAKAEAARAAAVAAQAATLKEAEEQAAAAAAREAEQKAAAAAAANSSASSSAAPQLAFRLGGGDAEEVEAATAAAEVAGEVAAAKAEAAAAAEEAARVADWEAVATAAAQQEASREASAEAEAAAAAVATAAAASVVAQTRACEAMHAKAASPSHSPVVTSGGSRLVGEQPSKPSSKPSSKGSKDKQKAAAAAAAHDEDDDEYDDDDDDWSDNGSRHEGTSPQGIGASLKTIMVRRLSFQKVEPPQEAEAARLVDLETLKHHSGTGSGAGSNDASLVAPDDSVSMAGRSERAMSAARTRHAALPEGARALDSLSAYEVALLLHTLELGRYADGFMALPVRGADLDAATEHDLEEVGMSVALHRRTLFAQIADFRVDGVSAHYLEQAAADAEAHHHAQQYGYHHAQPHGGGYDDHHHHHHQAHAGQQYGGYDNQYDAAGYGEDAYGYTLDASTQAAYAAQAAAYAAQPQQQPAEEAAEATAPSAADAQSSAAEAAVWAVAEAAVAEEAKQPEPDQLLPMRDELGSPAAPQQTQLAWLKEAEVSSRSPQPSSTELAAAAGEDEFLDSVRPRGFWDNLSFGFKGAFAMQPSAALCACTARRPRGVSEMWLNRDRDGTDAIPTGTSTPKKIITPVITTSPTTNSVC